MANIKFGYGVFEKDEVATLRWLGSPQRLGVNRQWMMKLDFVSENGLNRTCLAPWGVIPMLHFGQRFMGGSPQTADPVGMFETLYFTSNAKARVSRASCIPASLYPLPSEDNRSENCIVIQDSGQTILVPVVEIVRAFFGYRRWFALAAIDHDRLSDAVIATEEAASVSMKFSRDFPTALVQSPYLESLALMLFAAPWRSAFRSISRDRDEPNSRRDGMGQTLRPLSCFPPVLNDSEWRIRGVREGDITLVLEIVWTRQQESFPFARIEALHPSMKKITTIPGPLAESERGDNSLGDDEIVVDARQTPKRGTRAKSIGGSDVRHRFSTEPQIEVFKKPKQHEAAHRNGDIPAPARGNLDQPSTVSFGTEVQRGGVQPAEFNRTASIPGVPEIFADLIGAFIKLKFRLLTLEVEYQVGNIRKKGGLENDRLFVLITLTHHDRVANILEVQPSKMASAHWTVVLDAANQSRLSKHDAITLVESAFRADIGWDRKALDAVVPPISYTVAKHTAQRDLSWARRLYRKAFGVEVKQ